MTGLLAVALLVAAAPSPEPLSAASLPAAPALHATSSPPEPPFRRTSPPSAPPLHEWRGGEQTTASSDAGPSDQTLTYFNARMALREDQAREAIQLWLLRNAIESRTQRVSVHDPDFHSVTWAALGKLGLCPDGYPHDDDGAGLWPLGLHNWAVRAMRRRPRGAGPSPYRAFGMGRQQRWVSLRDVLDSAELRTLRLQRGGCLAETSILVASGLGVTAELRDKRVAARALRYLLRRAQQTLVPERVVGRSVLAARIFDINLRLADLARRARRRKERKARREARARGVSREEVAEHQATDTEPVIDPRSEEGRILAASLAWPPSEWMALSPERRQILFAHAAHMLPDAPAVPYLATHIIDRLAEQGRGAELQSFVAYLTARGDAESRDLVWGGERGRRLMGLERKTGFRERGVIALHRGVALLSEGRLPESLRSMALALRWAEDSRASEELRGLARRWLSYVAAQFQVSDELLLMLREVVPRGDFSAVLEDQLWHAAFAADSASFERCVRHQIGRGALSYRVAILTPLSKGDAGQFITVLAERLGETPYFTRRFLKQLVERLQAEDAGLRVRHVPMLHQLKLLLEEELAQDEGSKRRQRAVEQLVDQLRALIEGATGVVAATHPGDQAHALSPDRELFAGSLRIAPSDPLPWPFAVAQVEPPSVFTPIDLTPVEWRDEDGARVYGWRVSE